MESKEYLSEQIITYLGNKRSLLKEIEKEIIKIKKKLKKEKIVSCDLFSGSKDRGRNPFFFGTGAGNVFRIQRRVPGCRKKSGEHC